MKTTPKDIARAVIELCRSHDEKDHAAIMDSALQLLAERGMQRALRTFPDLVRDAWFVAAGTTSVTITTPSEGTAAEKKEIAGALEKELGGTIEIMEETDPTLIGGLKLTLGDDRLDFSLRSALTRAATRLASIAA